MNLTIEIKPEYLLITFEGPVEESFPTRFPEMLIETASAHKCPRILVDLRKVEGYLTTTQRYTMGETGAQKFHSAMEKGEIPFCRFSLVANPPLLDTDKFGEKVANNRGMPVRIFRTIQEAHDWLMQFPDPS
jgi:hypothetical protein